MSDRTGELLIGAAKVMAGILIILIASETWSRGNRPRFTDHGS
jgi:hypothetical protein